jgi:hypothetical protein
MSGLQSHRVDYGATKVLIQERKAAQILSTEHLLTSLYKPRRSAPYLDDLMDLLVILIFLGCLFMMDHMDGEVEHKNSKILNQKRMQQTVQLRGIKGNYSTARRGY